MPESRIVFFKAMRRIGNPGYIKTTIVDVNGKRTSVYRLAGEREGVRHVERGEIERLYRHALGHPLSAPDSVRLVLGDQLKTIFEKGPAVLGERGDVLVRGNALGREFGSRRGFGMVKIIWKHGERSGKAGTKKQVTKADIFRLPHLLRDVAPIVSAGQLTWNVERHDGEVVCYSLSSFDHDGGRNHVVSIHVHE